jgi:tetratricopeptide (TPR) repeat protein
MLEANEAADSLFAFERALQEDPYNWQAYFYRGRAYGVLGRIEDAQADFLTAARVGAGIGPVHQFASIASGDLEQFDTAWEHAIRAHQAGIDMREHFKMLRQVSPAPAELEARLEAPRLYVGPALVPDPEAQAVLDAVLRGIRLAISESTTFGLVTQPQLADYYLRLQINSVETEGRPRAGGALELLQTSGERLYDDGFTLQDVFDEVTTGRVLSGKLRELTTWLDRR